MEPADIWYAVREDEIVDLQPTTIVNEFSNCAMIYSVQVSFKAGCESSIAEVSSLRVDRELFAE